NCVAVLRVRERLAQRAGAAVVSVGDCDGGCRSVSLSRGPLCEREWDYAQSRYQKQVKRASKKMRFDRGADVCVHVACASVRKHLLLQARQGYQDFSPLDGAGL